jgi:hypothetical protein
MLQAYWPTEKQARLALLCRSMDAPDNQYVI